MLGKAKDPNFAGPNNGILWQENIQSTCSRGQGASITGISENWMTLISASRQRLISRHAICSPSMTELHFSCIHYIRYCRVEDGNIVLYDLIGASPTIGREDGSFGFGVFEYHEDRKLFVEEASREIVRVKNASGLCLGEGESRNDMIYYSSIPWIDFTDLKHAGKMSRGQSIPRISTGRLVPQEDRLMMSVSVELNHGLADGYHVAQFFRLLNML